MKTMFLAAAAALTLGVGSAYASEAEGGTIANTRFTTILGVVAQAPAQGAPARAAARNGQVVQAYVTQSGRGTWLFPPNENGNG
jgi:hypothetical protein